MLGDTSADLAIVLAAVGQTAFVAVYSLGRWWPDFVGRALFSKSAALMLLIDVAVINMITDYSWEREAEVILYWLVMLSIWYQFGALIRQRRRGDDE